MAAPRMLLPRHWAVDGRCHLRGQQQPVQGYLREVQNALEGDRGQCVYERSHQIGGSAAVACPREGGAATQGSSHISEGNLRHIPVSGKGFASGSQAAHQRHCRSMHVR